jgi:sterol 3beta-glucosyltransferase
MKILIITFGSRGDVQPYVALGKGLQIAGHTVTICTSSSFESFVTEHGLRYAYASNELLKLMDSEAGRGAMEDTNGVFGAVKSTLSLMKEAKVINRQLLYDSWAAAQAAEPDLIIFHPKVLSATSIAEKLDVPVMLAMPVPIIVPTTESPTIGLPDLKVGGWYNKATYQLIQMGYRTYAGMVDEFRQDVLGLDKSPKSAGLLYMANHQPVPVLHAYSEHVVPRPHDWPDQAHVTGYWFLDRLTEWEPSAELQAFLEAGEPPVYVGFGSMAGRNPQGLTHIVIEALQQAQVRGLIATGWGGLDVNSLPDTIFKLDQAPHDWLFPRVAAVVHHGGAGTTAAGLRAGRPTIICPFFGDQPFWGRRVQALGVGSKPIPQKNLTVDKLAAAIREVTISESIQQNAAVLGEKIRQEDGIANAVSIIERALLQSERVPH